MAGVFGKCLVALAVLSAAASAEESHMEAQELVEAWTEEVSSSGKILPRRSGSGSVTMEHPGAGKGAAISAPGAPASTPFPYPDIPDANALCGSPATITTCDGWPTARPVCLNTQTGQACYTGVCVCSTFGGCMDATCVNTGEPCLGPTCGDGVRCMTMPGTGWSCWHPCNMVHQLIEYGVNSGVVQSIRESGACAAYIQPGQQQGPLFNADKNLDAGLQLTAEAYPIFGGESQDNAGGSCRRRSAPGSQEDDQTDAAQTGAAYAGGQQPVSGTKQWR